MENTPLSKKRYTNYEDYTIIFDSEAYEFECYYKKEKFADCKIEGFYKDGKKEIDFSEFAYCKILNGYKKTNNSQLALSFYDHVPEFDYWDCTESKPVCVVLLKPSNYNVAVEIQQGEGFEVKVSGAYQPSVLWASDIFDAARIGDDIFTWEENITNLGRIQEFYPLHNIQLHVDADNVVIREEFNDIEQAKSRAVSISLLGLPFTFGDDFKVLDEARVDILKRALPIIDMHPMDLTPANFNREDMLINLNIVKDYEEYQVSGVFNMKETAEKRVVKFDDDLHLEDGKYLVYDYFRNEFLGICENEIELDFVPYEVRVLALRPFKAVPQVVSTSRHITQGAAEIRDMAFENNAISITADLVANDSYTVSVYVPDGYTLKGQSGFDSAVCDGNIAHLTFMPSETKEYSFCISFEK